MVVTLPLSVLGDDYLIFHGDDADPNIWANYLGAFTEFKCNTIRLGISTQNAPHGCSRYDQAKMNTVLNHLNSVGVKAILADFAGSGAWYGSQAWVNDWVALANTYKNDARVIAFQPVNECYPGYYSSTGPAGGVTGYDSLVHVMAYLIDQIRAVDPNRKIIFPIVVGLVDDCWDNWSGFYSSLTTHGILSKGNLVYDVVHPYYFEGSFDMGMTPTEKADWYRTAYLLPAISYFGAANIWCGETFGVPAWEKLQDTYGVYAHQLEFELRMIKHFVDNGVGFQYMWYFTYYYFNSSQIAHDILTQSAYYTGSTPPPPAGKTYVFDHWVINGQTVTANPLSLAISVAVTIQAVYTEKVVTRTLTISATVGGSTSPVLGAYTYNDGATASVNATPSSGYRFVNWLLDGAVQTANPITVTMNADHNLQAIFALTTYNLTISSVGGGVTNPVVGTYMINQGATAQVTATPNSGYRFVNWLLDGLSSTTNPITFTMNSNRTLQAIFEAIPQFQLTIPVTAGGSTNPAAGTYTYLQGTTAQVTAIPASGYAFTNWTLDGANAGTANPFTIQMNANHSLQANFASTTITLNVTAGPNGAVSPVGSFTLTIGASYQFTATGNAGYHLDHWDLSGSNLGSSNPLAITVTAGMNNQTLIALFVVTPPTTISMTLATVGNGSVIPSTGPHTFNLGDSVTFTATPASGYYFSAWVFDGASYTANPLTLTIDASMNGKTLQAVFMAIVHTLAISASAGGTTSPTPGVYTLQQGQTQQVAALPSTGYLFDHWELDGVNISTTNTYAVTMNADHALLAVFILIPPVTLTISAAPGGATYPSVGTYPYAQGQSAQVTALPETNHRFVSWSLDGASRPENPITVYMDQNHLLQAVFEYVPPPPIVATIAGTVFDSITSNPIPAAAITADGYADITETNGAYAFISLTPQKYTLKATKDGYLPQSFVIDASLGGTISVDIPMTPVPPAPTINAAPVAATLFGIAVLLLSGGK